MSIFSSAEQLEQIKKILSRYTQLPFSEDTIPGAIMEATLANVRKATVLNTYDFVDVIHPGDGCGWQVKSTKEQTPVTWKRAKIPDAAGLIEASRKSPEGLQELGDAIINFCNRHAQESLKLYDLKQIGYCRLVVHPDRRVTYFERLLCTQEEPLVFDPRDFEWRWSEPKQIIKKEQLPALHGIHRKTTKKWWAWHGLGENQLHFSGESSWWPRPDDVHAVFFPFPTPDKKLSLEKLLELLSELDLPS